MKTILLVCSAGMSTSLLVTKMQKAAANQNFDVKIYAVSASELLLEAENNSIDVILLGPQVRYMEDELKNREVLKNIPIAVINMIDYGMMNGEKVLEFAKDLI
ncbi:PTS sugar transporter subunit IIB [Clostridium perfringens]|uniref:PTS sugar transporter subunit IIB n=1 Tax=Clostridium perfringens TaxID=1502 RepID=UPI003BA97DEC|nr:PTS sugar transporter subunit IIB [Clostridium perfringens]